jgi:prepilin peptidase dependent protein B
MRAVLPSKKIKTFILPLVLPHLGVTVLILAVPVLVVHQPVVAMAHSQIRVQLHHYTTAVNTNRLNQQLQAAMQLMVNDIRRAGYWTNAYTLVGTDTNTNPFQSTVGSTDVTVGGTGNSCILFTYDHLGTGVLPSISSTTDDDRYGYRLNGTSLQTRPWGGTFSCSAAATNWENVTDSTVTITALTFTLTTQNTTTGLGTSALNMRSVDITLTGRLTSVPTITKTLTEHVRIRNDQFVP